MTRIMYPIDEASVCLKTNTCINEYTELVDKMMILFVHLYEFEYKQLANKLSTLM